MSQSFIPINIYHLDEVRIYYCLSFGGGTYILFFEYFTVPIIYSDKFLSIIHVRPTPAHTHAHTQKQKQKPHARTHAKIKTKNHTHARKKKYSRKKNQLVGD